MKKIAAFLCLIALCLPLYACSPSLAAEESETKTEVKTETVKQKPKGEIVYPETFAVGFARYIDPDSFTQSDLNKLQQKLNKKT